MPGVSNAVFLSYASEDAEAAERIATALRNAGIEVWFDKSELRGGEAWDRQIRDQIHDCRLFVAVISAHTEARDEGYFRREWRLAVERAGDMHEKKAFLVPVVIDGTSERGAAVPEKFRELQWTRLPGGETTSAAFVDRIKRLLSPEPQATSKTDISAGTAPTLSSARSARSVQRALLAAVVVAIVGVGTYLAYERPWAPKRAVPTAPSPAAPPSARPTAFNPPPHSIAVLPFVNMSGDKDQEYFSEGLTEELLNSLSRINELQVAARTSSFSFATEHPDIATVAHKLNVGAVLEGSVRRSAHTVRVTAQLINGVTGFHLWSQTYDRSLGDVLQLQTDIATAVASALKVTLLGGEAAKIEVGGTHNPAAFDAYLRATKIFFGTGENKAKAAIAGYTEAIGLDPDYALAYAARSIAISDLGLVSDAPKSVSFDKAQTDARKAIALAPGLAEGHLALAVLYENALEFKRASDAYEQALALGGGNARVLRDYGRFAVAMGRKEIGLSLLLRAKVLDPLNLTSHTFLASALYYLRRFEESNAVFKDAKALEPDWRNAEGDIGIGYYSLGDYQAARSHCETQPAEPFYQLCLAVTYHKLGRQADAETMLAKARARRGDSHALDYSEVYAQWGNTTKALQWLETALRLHDPEFKWLKLDPWLDPVRNEPRFQAIERALKFPD